jgi:hypothetical protein
MADRLRANREELKRAYGAFYEEISALLFEHDPMGINFSDNTDEYEPEVDLILPCLSRACDAVDVQRIVHEIFERMFSIGARMEDYEEVSRAIWAAYRRFTTGS